MREFVHRGLKFFNPGCGICFLYRHSACGTLKDSLEAVRDTMNLYFETGELCFFLCKRSSMPIYLIVEVGGNVVKTFQRVTCNWMVLEDVSHAITLLTFIHQITCRWSGRRT